MFKGPITDPNSNSAGYVDAYPSKEKSQEEYRIVMLGGSTVVLGNPSIPTLLTEEFHSNGYLNVNVYNFGVTSAVSSQELMTIVTEVIDLSPDLIIQYDGVNDIYHPLYYDPRPGYTYDFMAYETSPLLYPKSFSALKYVIYKSYVIRFIAERLFPSQYMNQFLPLQKLRKEVNYGTDVWRKQIVNTYTANIQTANIISQAFGSEYIAILQPNIYTKKILSSTETQLISQDDVSYFTKAQQEIVENMIQSEYKNIHFLDLTTIFDSIDETVYIDAMHILQNKQSIIAKAIYDYIITVLQVPK